MKPTNTDIYFNVHDFSDYKEFLRKMLPTTGHSRGIRAKLAAALGCNAAFVSQVLHGEAHFAMEHIIGVSKFLNLSQPDTQFLMLLVQRARAASEDLKQYLSGEISRALRLRDHLVEREFITPTDHDLIWTTYFSTWLFSVVHAITSIPAYQTPHAIASYLSLPTDRVQFYLDFLTQFELVKNEDGLYKIMKKLVYLEPKSPLSSIHHTNWRMRALQSLEQGSDTDFHYSAVISVSEKDAHIIREILRNSVKDSMGVLSGSDEEVLYGMVLDFFRV